MIKQGTALIMDKGFVNHRMTHGVAKIARSSVDSVQVNADFN